MGLKFFLLMVCFVGFLPFLVGRLGFLFLRCHVSGHLYLSLNLPSVKKPFFLANLDI